MADKINAATPNTGAEVVEAKTIAPEIQGAKEAAPEINASELTTTDDNNSETNVETAEIVITGTIPVKFLKKNVNKTTVSVKGLSFKASEDRENVAGTFSFQVKETVWGTIVNELEQTIYVETAHSFPASEWGVIPTLRADMLFGRIVDYMLKVMYMSKEEFDKEFAHRFDGMKVDIVQIYVPANTPFVNPWTSATVPRTAIYERDYVFTFITGFHYDIKNLNHKDLLKDIYDGMPYEEDGEVKSHTAKFRVCPDDYVESIIEKGYLGQPTEKEVERLIKTIEYNR